MATPRKDAGRGRGRGGIPRTPSVTADAPRLLNVMEFAAARQQELTEVKEALKSFSGTRRAFQTLPKNLRRRTMSHNIYRLPVKMRERAKREQAEAEKEKKVATGTEATKSRKKRRRPNQLSSEFAQRQRTNKWLETHLWHAKRMKMVALWGFKLALHPTDRSVKACYKATAHFCTLYDASYYTCIELRGAENAIVSLFSRLVDPDQPSVASRLFIDGRREGSTVVHHPDAFPYRPIAPVTFHWRPRGEEPRQLWVWVHPAAAEEFLQVLTPLAESYGVTATSLRGELLRFELRGPRSHSVLDAVLRICENKASSASASSGMSTSLAVAGRIATHPEAASVWRTLRGMRTSASLPSGSIIAITTTDPRLDTPPSPAVTTATAAADISREVNELLYYGWSPAVADSPLWDKGERCRQSTAVEPESAVIEKRSYQRMDLDTLLAAPPLLASTTSTTTTTTTATSARGGLVSVLVLQHPGHLSRGFGAGYDLVLPSGWGRVFWKGLVFAGARAIGLRERLREFAEQAAPAFPMDFPDTRAGKEYAEWVAVQQKEEYDKRPPAKRVNYALIGVEAPFAPDWSKVAAMETEQSDPTSQGLCVLRGTAAVQPISSLQAAYTTHEKTGEGAQQWQPREAVRREIPLPPRALVRVIVKMAHKGTPKANAMICAPTTEDYEQWRRHVQVEAEEPLHKQKVPTGGQLASRKLIGYVTEGAFSFVRGSGVAIGFCSAAALIELFHTGYKQFGSDSEYNQQKV